MCCVSSFATCIDYNEFAFFHLRLVYTKHFNITFKKSTVNLLLMCFDQIFVSYY